MNVGSINLMDSMNSDVLKVVETFSYGVNLSNVSRVAIGYVMRGHKTIHCAPEPIVVSEGSLYVIGEGQHFVENGLGESHFEEIVFYVPTLTLQRMVLSLSDAGCVNTDATHRCPHCRGRTVAVTRLQSKQFKKFIDGVNSCLVSGDAAGSRVIYNLRVVELLYFILTSDDLCLRSILLRCCDANYIEFLRVIYENIYKDLSIEELARLTHRSVTSFKKEFQRCFAKSPHQWYIEQRLFRAKAVLISTNLTISEIGNMCAFTNISHFIKLFKNFFDMTPAAMRRAFREKSRIKESKHTAGESVSGDSRISPAEGE